MSHISSTTSRARVTDHAVRRYAERWLGVVIETDDDREAVRLLRERKVDVARIRARCAEVGGLIVDVTRKLGRSSGAAVAFPEGLRFQVVDGTVVTVLARVVPKPSIPAPPTRTPTVLELGSAA